MPKKVALFVSGGGSLLPGFFSLEQHLADFEISCVVASQDCPAVELANRAGKSVLVTPKADSVVLEFLVAHNVGLICLAGYLKIIPADFIEQFAGRILNTHPSLLPKYGGKGMHGDKVHQAVMNNAETETGFTVHEVTPVVDAGPIVFQANVIVEPTDDWQSVKAKVQTLEKEHYPRVAAEFLIDQSSGAA